MSANKRLMASRDDGVATPQNYCDLLRTLHPPHHCQYQYRTSNRWIFISCLSIPFTQYHASGDLLGRVYRGRCIRFPHRFPSFLLYFAWMGIWEGNGCSGHDRSIVAHRPPSIVIFTIVIVGNEAPVDGCLLSTMLYFFGKREKRRENYIRLLARRKCTNSYVRN